jgi:hypothetical protein
MDEVNSVPTFSKEVIDVAEQLKDAQQYIKELFLQNCLNALVLAGLVGVVFETFSFLLFGATMTDLGITLYKFSLLIGPSALFLLFLHLFELHGLITRGEKSVPLTLDLMYFLYVGIAFPTMVGIQWYYQRHLISSTFLTPGWSLLVTMLCAEVVVALFLAKYLITKSIAPKLPHFFIHRSLEQHHLTHPHLIQQPLSRPKRVFYFRKKADVLLWEDEDCFIRFNQERGHSFQTK